MSLGARMVHFINPYTFLPWPRLGEAGLDRGAPAGHDLPQVDGWHGVLEGELVACSPVLVRWPGTGSDYAAPRRRMPDGHEVYLVPGSSLHGALRALHEVAAGGCLRIFDDEFLPAYRDLMRAGGLDEWRLAVVEEVDDGRPTRMRLADMVPYKPSSRHQGGLPRAGAVWVAAAALPPQLVTGERLSLTVAPVSRNRFRPEYAGGVQAARDPGGDWVVLLTDEHARPRKGGYFVTVGRLGSASAAPTAEAWRDYQSTRCPRRSPIRTR